MGKFEETKKKMINAWRGGKPEDVIPKEPDLEFDMYYAGTIVEFAVMLLLERGKPIRYPGIVTDDDGSRVEEYYSPDHIPSTKKIGGVEITKF